MRSHPQFASTIDTGPDHHEVAKTRMMQARTAARAGDRPTAMRLAAEALPVLERRLGSDDAATREARSLAAGDGPAPY